jgi:hypothetical protein
LASLTTADAGQVTDAALEGPFGFCLYASTPGQVVSLDTFYVGRLKGVGAVWQLTAVDVATRIAVVQLIVGDKTAAVAAGFPGPPHEGTTQARDQARRHLVRYSMWVRGVEPFLSAGGEGSVPSGTCPPWLLDRLERLATPCLLTVQVGGATAGGSRCPVENPATPPTEVGIPVSECLERIVLYRLTGCRRSEQGNQEGHRK